MVAEVSALYSEKTPVDRNPRSGIAKLFAPLSENVNIVVSQVVANLVHDPIIVYKRIPAIRTDATAFQGNFGRKIRWAAGPREWKYFPRSAARWTLKRVEVIPSW